MAISADIPLTGVDAASPRESDLSVGQKLALKYFVAAMVLFAAQTVFGLLAGLQFI